MASGYKTRKQYAVQNNNRASRAMPRNWFIVLFFSSWFLSSVQAEEGVLESLQAINQSIYHQVGQDSLGRPIHVIVKLPDSYAEDSKKRFPAIYLLDGGEIFPTLAGYYNYLRSQGDIPEAIVVGLSYGADNFEDGNYRSTDYTAPTDQRTYWGGAAEFQQVLIREVLPLIESEYRADPAKRVIFGQSIGGQFVLFTALTDPNLFFAHIASNPALHRNLDFFLETHSDSQATGSKLFMASGSEDEPRFREPAVKWINYWSGQESPPWQLEAITIKGYGHFSLLTESFRQGLIWVFDEA